jgi:hypothetical protein
MVKGQHLRRAPYRPRLEFAIGLFALAVCGLGIGLVMVYVLEKSPSASRIPPSTTTTTALINSSVIEPATTTTVAPTTTTTLTPVPRKGPPVFKNAVANGCLPFEHDDDNRVAEDSARGRTVSGGQDRAARRWRLLCAKFVSWTAEQAQVEGWESSDSPARLHKIAMEEGRIVAEPYPGVMVFIDLTGQNFANQYVSHVGIVESVNGDEFVSIEGNADSSGLVTRQTRRVGDGYVIAFAEFGPAS